jgi:hypothetical protein
MAHSDAVVHHAIGTAMFAIPEQLKQHVRTLWLNVDEWVMFECLQQFLQGCQFYTSRLRLSAVAVADAILAMVNVDFRLHLHRRSPLLYSYILLP